MSNDVTKYDDWAVRHTAAFTAFKTVYEATHRPPERPAAVSRQIRVVDGLLFVLMTASMVVSGAHTIPVVLDLTPVPEGWVKLVVGVSAFVMVEVAIIVLSYVLISSALEEDVRRPLTLGLRLAMTVALAANVYSTVTAIDEELDPFNGGIAVLIGIAAPILAKTCGDVLGQYTVDLAARRAEALQVYEDELSAWEEGLRRAWASKKSGMGATIKVEKPSTDTAVVHVQDVQDRPYGRPYGHGYSRENDARTIVNEYLDENPTAVSMSVRQLADMLGVSKSTVSNVKRERKG